MLHRKFAIKNSEFNIQVFNADNLPVYDENNQIMFPLKSGDEILQDALGNNISYKITEIIDTKYKEFYQQSISFLKEVLDLYQNKDMCDYVISQINDHKTNTMHTDNKDHKKNAEDMLSQFTQYYEEKFSQKPNSNLRLSNAINSQNYRG